MDESLYSEKHRAEVFLEILESMLKGISPTVYAQNVSAIMDSTFDDVSKMAMFPPHYLIHSIEANCAYHRGYRNDELNSHKFEKILNHYKKYYDPVAKYFLSEIDGGLYPFLINIARQQFYLQYSYGGNDLGRAIIIFHESKYHKAEELFKNKYGLSYKDWLLVGFGIYAGIHNKRFAYISPGYFTKSSYKIASDETVQSLFKLISITVDEVKDYYKKVRSRIGSKLSTQYDTYIQGAFTERPLLKFNENQYLVIHKPIFLKKITEGIFDLCKSEWSGEFGNEFGRNFERYIKNLLKEFIPEDRILTENCMRRFTNKKICDFVINNDDSLYLIECKGTEYSSYTATINAMKQDNSTKKITSGIEQIVSTADLIKQGTFLDILGDTSNKRIISSLITFKQLYLVNIQWYWDKIITFTMNSIQKKIIDTIFEYRPQILSVSELEQFLLYSVKQNKSHLEIFQEKLEQDESVTGDWSVYLKNDNERIKLLEVAFDKFYKDFLPDNSSTYFD
ncbi:MAG: hypothetical protein PHI90_10250 [Clostridia bacterium]|nr:hypothetical protein [Clostridia bacterium]MDD4049171.1 hypothetical protein [Clostridia bacterium]